MPTRTISVEAGVERRRRRLSVEAWIGLFLGLIIVGSAGLVAVRFVLPGRAAPAVRADAGTAAVVADAAPSGAPDEAPVGPFTLRRTVDEDEARALAEQVNRHGVTRRGQPTFEYVVFLTALDTLVAALHLDADGLAADPTDLPAQLQAFVMRAGVADAVAATIHYVRATGELPPYVRDALRAFLRERSSVSVGWQITPAGRVPPYSAAALAVWLEPTNRRRLAELARANELLERWCDPLEPPERRFAEVLCERGALVEALRRANPRDPTARALVAWDEAVDELPFGAGSISLVSATYQPARAGEAQLTIEVRASGTALPAPHAFALAADGLAAPIRPYLVAGTYDEEHPAEEGFGGHFNEPTEVPPSALALTFAVPLEIVGPVLRVAGDGRALRVPPPRWADVAAVR